MGKIRELYNCYFTETKHISIHRRMMIYFLMEVLLIGSISWFSFINIRFYNDRYREILGNYVILNRSVGRIKQAEKHLYNFIYMRDSRNEINLFFTKIDEIETDIGNIKLLTNDIKEYILIRNLKNKIASCRLEADATIRANNNFKTDEVISHMSEIKKIASYIDDDVKELIILLLSQNENINIDAVRNTGYVQTMTIIVILGTVILGIFFSIIVSKSISGPLNEFTYSAENISRGNFNVMLSYSPYIEINRLIDVFKKMSVDIQNFIAEINRKALIEKKLKEKEVENLRMSNTLRESRLQALQAQINPHFLFNTLNIISRKAILENAEETSELINSLAKLMRYNFSKLDSVVELRDELENIKEYLSIQEARFGKRIRVDMKVDESALKTRIPCLVLQPLVENAFKHGVEGMEEGARIDIDIYCEKDALMAVISDNGVGMNTELVKEILREDDSYGMTYSKGVGIRNVRDRLELFYNTKGIMDIISKPGRGTKIVLSIPMDRFSCDVC